MVAVTGCQQKSEQKNIVESPFLFKSLDLMHKNPQGLNEWNLKSPEARYEYSRRLIKAKNPSGILFSDNKPSYNISADNGIIINDGDALYLEGNVSIEKIKSQKISIKGDRLKWLPNESLLVIEQRPFATTDNSIIQSDIVEFRQDKQELSFIGKTLIKRLQSDDKNIKVSSYEIRLQSGKWNLGNGSIKSYGPIIGINNTSNQSVPNYIKGYNMSGNTKMNYISVESCELNQLQQSLLANKCTWNWNEQKLIAEGSVLLERDKGKIRTMSDKLEARVGTDGKIILSSPKSKVISIIEIE